MMTKCHYYFLLNPSPWPLICTLNSFNCFFSFILFMKFYNWYIFLINIILVSMSMFFWWLMYTKEFNLEGFNSFTLESGVKTSMVLFISSEVFFFFSFFWSYFHFYLSPSMELGLMWPPFLLEMFDFLNVPLINTLLLMTSGATITTSHYYLMKGSYKLSNMYLFSTIVLGLIFTLMQAMEYNSAFFSLSDGAFGSTFFMLTGFHGLHVLIGTTFLIVVLINFIKISSSSGSCLSFELSSWYWHFVDVVWIFLYFLLYYMNN